MGTGWRRAFCTSIRRDPEATTSSTLERQQQQQQQQSPSSRSSRNCVKLGIGGGGGLFSGSGSGGSSNPSTPRLSRSTTSTPRFRTTSPPTPQSLDSPKLQCKTTTTTMMTESSDAAASAATIPNWKGSRPRLFDQSSSPRSPSRFALLKTALRLSRNRCGVCGDGVSAGGQRTAVFTAECSHAFHFPCISTHVRTQGCLVCPVCSATWHEVPLLSSSLHVHSPAGRPQQHGSRGGHSSKLGERNSSSSRGRREGERAAPAGMTKIYDDDESLQLSPTSRIVDGLLQFNPIPEELEAEVDEDEVQGQDDQGDCDEEREQGSNGDRIETISVVPDSLALVSTGRNHLSYVVSIKVKAPPLPPRPHATAAVTSSINKHVAAPVVVPPSLLDHPSCRSPIDLVTVLDVSGSMTVDKLQMLKRAMRLVICSLGPGDRLSIVAFSMAAAKRLFPLRRMSRPGKRSARQIVDRLVICGSTQAQFQSHHCSSTSCMGDALRKATQVLEDRRERNPVATIMLLSDGYCHGHDQQQEEEKDVHDIISRSRSQNHQPSSATRFTHIEIPIHASGGFRHLQQQQPQKHRMIPKNNNIPALEEENGFAKSVNELMSVVLQDVHLQFIFPSACGVISSVYSYGGECIGQAMLHGEGGKSVLLGDMYAEEERQLLVELKVPKATVLCGHSMSISVMCSYRDPLTRDVIHCGERPLIMSMPMPIQSQDQNHRSEDCQIPMMLRSSSSSTSSITIASSTQQQQQQLRNLFVTTRALAESRRLVELSDLDTALHLLSSARSLLLQQSTAISNTQKKLVISLEAQLKDLQGQQQRRRRQQQQQQPSHSQSLSPSQRRSEEALLGEAIWGGEPLTPTSAWRAADQLAKVAIMRKSLNRVSDLHGLENARF